MIMILYIYIYIYIYMNTQNLYLFIVIYDSGMRFLSFDFTIHTNIKILEKLLHEKPFALISHLAHGRIPPKKPITRSLIIWFR